MKLKIIPLLFVTLIVCITFLLGCSKKENGSANSTKNVTMTESTPYHIKYDIKGKESGTLDLFVSGKNIKFEINSNQDSKDVKAEIYKYEDEMVMTSNESGKKLGIKMKIDEKQKNDLTDFTNITKIKEQLKNYKKEGTEDVLGYKCNIYSTDTSKVWLYEDFVALKFQNTKKDNTEDIITAVLFEPDVKLADDFFVVPKDIEVVDIEELMKGMDKPENMPDEKTK